MTKRVTITLDQEHFDLLQDLAKYYGQPPSTLAADMLVQTMFDAESAIAGGEAFELEILARMETSAKPH